MFSLKKITNNFKKYAGPFFTASRTKTFWMIAVLLPLLILFIFVIMRSGPMASKLVTVASVTDQQISPALFGIGTVEARSFFKIGPNAPGRVRSVYVNVGDHVRAHQLLAMMERPDLDILEPNDAERDFIRKTLKQQERDARENLTTTQSNLATLQKQNPPATPAQIKKAQAQVNEARSELRRVIESSKNPLQPSANQRLVAPIAGLVVARNIEPGTTVVAGQSVIDIIDPASLWLNVRFDQIGSAGLQAGLKGQVMLRSQTKALAARVLRVEPIADPVTEEILAKVTLDTMPTPPPAIGELAEITIALPALPQRPTISNASLVRVGDDIGVWLVRPDNKSIRFVKVKTGASDLDGQVQIHEGLKVGDRVVVHSNGTLGKRNRIKIVDQLIKEDQ